MIRMLYGGEEIYSKELILTLARDTWGRTPDLDASPAETERKGMPYAGQTYAIIFTRDTAWMQKVIAQPRVNGFGHIVRIDPCLPGDHTSVGKAYLFIYRI